MRLVALLAVLGVLIGGCTSSKSGHPAGTSAHATLRSGTGTTAAPPSTVPSTSGAASTSARPAPRPTPHPAVSAGQTSAGRALVSGARTLYYNSLDTATSVQCTGDCTTQWPPVLGIAKVGAGVAAADLGVVHLPDGSSQVTYRGHPLYRFIGDQTAGQVRGDGKSGIWHVALVVK